MSVWRLIEFAAHEAPDTHEAFLTLHPHSYRIPNASSVSQDSPEKFMADFEEYVSFKGYSDDEAETFIRAVNIQAFKAQKLKDTEWIAGFASTGFAGKALRWYRRLPMATRQDWELLQEAILDHEWKEDLESPSLITPAAAPTYIPTAAAPMASTNSAPIALAETLDSLSLSPQTGTSRTARIRVLAEDPTHNGYLGLEDGLGYAQSSITGSLL
ncbi:hypothetical protein FS837_004281, partial [Tulasnella sp. UAMH 9824]